MSSVIQKYLGKLRLQLLVAMGILLVVGFIGQVGIRHTVQQQQMAVLGEYAVSAPLSSEELAYILYQPRVEHLAEGQQVMQSAGMHMGMAGWSAAERQLAGILWGILAAVGLLLAAWLHFLAKAQADEWNRVECLVEEIFSSDPLEERNAAAPCGQPQKELPRDSLCGYLQERLSRQRQEWQRERLYSSDRELQLKATMENLVHQIKTPLAGISLVHEWLLEHEIDPACLELLEQGQQKVEVLQELTRQFLYEAKIKAETAQYMICRQPLRPLLLRVSDTMEEILQSRGQRLLLSGDLDAELPFDSYWLKEALLNVCRNAGDHSGENTDIHLQVMDEETELEIRISDEGPGISPEQEQQIFRRFVGDSSVEDSTGIGLHMAREIVRRHGGTLYLEQQVEHGTCFCLCLPKLTGKEKRR